eukprot:TRINITY_DN7689_c1_g1_i1.p1 TRINITY_DN7689_c1_g1~~TRINITY_DN7689_c1_g1_i1.p1  ORF type:complete len:287 (+),score=94.25 TRINITY_DN7689_c1_g1_i1:95-862(+)
MARRACLAVSVLALAFAAWGHEDEEEEFIGDLAEVSRDAKIAGIELEISEAVQAAEPSFQRLRALRQEQRDVDNGWFFQGTAAKAMQPAIDRAERDYAANMREVDILRASVKPLYGVVSVQHLQEHREYIYQSFEQAIETGKSNMWWDAILGRGGRDDSLEELLMRLAFSFLTGLSFGYVIGLIKFVLTSPFTIAQYCSSVLDIPAALGMWVIGIILFLLPLVAAYYACVLASELRKRQPRHQGRPQYRELRAGM